MGVFQELPSGLKFLDIRKGSGPTPKVGDQVTVHWAGFTAGYRQHRMDNTSIRDEPYRFTVGDPGTIKAFSEAVQLMGKGGLCRIEVPGELMEVRRCQSQAKRSPGELMEVRERRC